jgi:hypothetical protein
VWQQTAGGALVAAVADGAGTAPLSDVGSDLAARSAVKHAVGILDQVVPCDNQGWQVLLRNVFRKARKTVESEAAGRGHSALDLATTLLVAIVTPEVVVAGQVGDGAVVVRHGDDTFHAVTRPAPGEYINETTFLTSNDSLKQIQFAVHKGAVTGLAMFSDGLQMLALKMPQGEPHSPFFVPLLKFVSGAGDPSKAQEQLRGFLQSPKITDRADDDLTLLLAVKNGAC